MSRKRPPTRTRKNAPIGRARTLADRVEKIRINKLLAMQEAMAWSTVAITSTAQGFGHGSGIGLKIGERCFIATANHVIENEPRNENLLFVCRNEGPLSYVPHKREVPQRLFGGRDEILYNIAQPFAVSRRLVDPQADGALLELASPSSLQNLRFHEIPDLDRMTPGPGTQVAITGFAAELGQRVHHVPTGVEGVMVFPYSDLPTIVPPRDALEDFDLELSFLMDYPYDPEDSAQPFGMSGCGVWLIREQLTGDIWAISGIELAGIQTHWYRKPALLKAVRIERLIRLARESEGAFLPN